VLEVEDLDRTPSRFPVASDVLIWTLDGARAVVRPSGTEPKLKGYAEAVEPVGADGDVEAARARALVTVNAVLDAVAELLGSHGL
jgi:phosphomannomutase